MYYPITEKELGLQHILVVSIRNAAQLAEIKDTNASSPYQVLQLYFPLLQKDLGPWSPWGKFIRCRAKVDRLLYTEIEESLQKYDESRTDILSLLITAKNKNGEYMTYEELHDELITLLIVGHDTTATAIVWAL